MITDDPNIFIRRLNRRASNVKEGADRLRRAVIQEMFQEVVYATPADTGLARTNWQVGVNVIPDELIKEPHFPGRHLGLAERLNAGITIIGGMPVIEMSRVEDNVYIANNVPYIQRLNDGYSQQAPANFIELAFDRARKRIQRARKALLDG